MAAAFAALVSLQHIIETIKKHHASHLKSIGENPLIETVRRRASSLQDFLEGYCYSPAAGGDGPQRDDAQGNLESRIADAAYAAEDILESYIVDRILVEYNSSTSIQAIADRILAGEYSSGGIWENSSSIDHDFGQRLEEVIKDMEALLIEDEVKKMMSKEKKVRNSALPSSSSSSPPPSTGKNAMVGFDEYLNQAMEKLTGQGLDLQLIPIIGMGGIGKTTLAKNVRANPLIMQYFDLRAWATISQEYSVRDILSCLLRDINRVPGNRESSADELGRELRKELYGRRYLIVLDDMWSVEPWEKVKMYFPDNNNGSRIIITTRISNLASYFGSNCSLKIGLLDDDNSWNLFSQRVFGDEGCPDLELVELGKMIAEKCRGLPLSIVTIAGLLAKSDKTQEYWKFVSENLNSIINLEENEHCFKILSLSYSHLPVHLKPCFLYMAVFPEDYEIRVSKLIKLWVAEGFLKPKRDKSLEEVAEECLYDLIGRNLISVQDLGSRGKIRFCTMHDLLRELCLKESQKDKFLCVSNDTARGMKNSQRRFAIHESLFNKSVDPELIIGSVRSMPLLRSLIYDSCLDLPLKKCRLLRVLSPLWLDPQKDTIDHHFNSRYLDSDLGRRRWEVPSSIHLFWNLQTVNIVGGHSQGVVSLPSEIWKMSQLKHLKVYNLAILPAPPSLRTTDKRDESNIVLENLETILTLINFVFTEEVVRRIPNIKRLKVVCRARPVDFEESSPLCPFLQKLDPFRKLESLFISLDKCGHSVKYRFQQTFNFPVSLKKLVLDGGHLPWESITMIGALPNLEALKLWDTAFFGDEWNAVEGEFRSLKFLEIQNFYLSPERWAADETCFPCLEHLRLQSVHDLVEIPMGIGDIPTLQSIYVNDCQPSVLDSAKKILEEQRSYGNDSLQVLTWDGPISLDEAQDGSQDKTSDESLDDK